MKLELVIVMKILILQDSKFQVLSLYLVETT